MARASYSPKPMTPAAKKKAAAAGKKTAATTGGSKDGLRKGITESLGKSAKTIPQIPSATAKILEKEFKKFKKDFLAGYNK